MENRIIVSSIPLSSAFCLLRSVLCLLFSVLCLLSSVFCQLSDYTEHITLGNRIATAVVDGLDGAAGRSRQGIFHLHGL